MLDRWNELKRQNLVVRLENHWSHRPQEDSTTDEDRSMDDETEVEEVPPAKKRKGNENKPLKVCLINNSIHILY